MRGLLAVVWLLFCGACAPKNTIQIQISNQLGIVGGEIVSSQDPVAASTIQIITVYTEPGKKPVYSNCTGILISPSVVLTAAHCTEENPFDMYIYFSKEVPPKFSDALRDYKNTPYLQQVTGGIVTAKWPYKKENQLKNWGDLALLRFAGGPAPGYEPVDLIPESIQLQTGMKITLAGFGLMDGKNDIPTEQLRKVQVLIANPEYSKTEILVGDHSGKGSCRGDSGGPAYLKIGSQNYLLGVTSRSDVDETLQFVCNGPSIYTSILFYRDWILSSLQSFQDPQFGTGKIPQPWSESGGN